MKLYRIFIGWPFFNSRPHFTVLQTLALTIGCDREQRSGAGTPSPSRRQEAYAIGVIVYTGVGGWGKLRAQKAEVQR